MNRAKDFNTFSKTSFMSLSLPQLNPAEIRVLGSLMEKSKITPDYYPMTLNALTAACNQKTSRKPVVEYDEAFVLQTLNSLKGQNLVSVAVGGTSRVNKYLHHFTHEYVLNEAEMAIICLLFLRGPQTPGELNTNSGRLHEFLSLESVMETLQKLMHLESPFVKELPRKPGQKEPRYTHLFGESIETDDEELIHSTPTNHLPNTELEQRVALLETELAEVKENLNRLMKELLG